MTAEVLAKAEVPEAAPAEEARKKWRDEPARQGVGGLEASPYAGATQDGEPEKCQLQQQPKPKPKLQLTLQPELWHECKPKPKATPIPARRWETVQPWTQSQKSPASPGPARMTGFSMAERRLILTRDESMPPPNRMDQEIASAINRSLFHRQAPAHIAIMNARRNANGTITAITHKNATAEMGLWYRDIITAARTVDKGVVDVQENGSLEMPKIHAVPLVQYMGKGTEGLQKLQEEFEVENEGVTIHTQVQ